MNGRKLTVPPLLALMLLGSVCSFAAPPVHLDRKGEKWAATTLRKMTLEEKIGQMIMVWARARFLNVDSPEFLQMQDEMRTYHVGGFGLTIAGEGGLLTKSQPLEAALLTNELQKDSKYPLLFAADFERGRLVRDSFIRPNRLFTVEQSLILYAAGKVKSEKLNEIRAKIRGLFA